MGPIVEVELSLLSAGAATARGDNTVWSRPYEFIAGAPLPFRTAIVIDPPVSTTKGILRNEKVVAVPKDYVLKKDEILVECYIAVRCQSNVTVRPGDTVRLKLELEYYPQFQYEPVTPGATFTLRWGGGERVVGRGTVLSRTDP